MSIRRNSLSEKRLAVKAVLMSIAIVAFGILHVAGAMKLHGAATQRPVDASEAMANRD